MIYRRIIGAFLSLALVVGACDSKQGSEGTPRRTPPQGAPNFLILLSDDQSFRIFDRALMPRVFGDLVDRGVNFTRAYVNVPLCCPSRVTLLTGLRAGHTGVDTNSTKLEREGGPARPTFVRALYESGYRTMLAGKYLNSETCAPREGWDRWACIRGGGQIDPTINDDGRRARHQGYTTDLLADRVVKFISDARADARPFFALYSPNSPHEPANDPRAQSMPITINNPPSYDAQPDPASLPQWVRADPFNDTVHTEARSAYERMARQLPLLDSNIGRILDALGPDAENTFVLFMSDNGYLYGEHRLGGKSGSPYEESVRVPFVIRYPGIPQGGRAFTSGTLVGNADVAATIMEIAGIPWSADGRSLVPILNGGAPRVRDDLLLEWCTVNKQACVEERENRTAPVYRGVVTERYSYIEYETGEAELYDLSSDPFQLRNLAVQSSHASLRRQLSARIAALAGEPATPETTIASGPQDVRVRNSAEFEFFSPALSTTFRCMLEGPGRASEWAPCDGGRVRYEKLKPGTYRFRVHAVDERSAADPTPAERAFEVAA